MTVWTGTVDLAKQIYNITRAGLRNLSPAVRRKRQLVESDRLQAETLLADLSSGSDPVLDGKVLVDGVWFNANYWLRLAIVRRALGLSHLEEVGFTGRYHGARSAETFARMGISRVVDLHQIAQSADIGSDAATRILDEITEPGDLIAHDWPSGLPGTMVYDHLLRCQRRGVVELDDPRLPTYVDMMLRYIGAARRFIDQEAPDLVILSEVGAFAQVSLICECIDRRIPVVVVRAVRGRLRLLRPKSRDDIFLVTNRPQPADIEALSTQQQDILQELGCNEINRRVTGCAGDPGAQKAYSDDATRIRRRDICKAFDWPEERPIVSLYAPNWFDRPHAFGMSHFRDFVDWVDTIIDVAKSHPNVSWLIKEHPSDYLYAGTRLHDIVNENMAPHIRIADGNWYGRDVVAASDGILTHHGTIGIEAPANGTPVLVPDRGYYHDLGFVTCASSRQRYRQLLREPWWQSADTDRNKRYAEIFAGIHYCAPPWQGGLEFPNDFAQDRIYGQIPGLLSAHREAIGIEIELIRDWFLRGETSYHPNKMRSWLERAVPSSRQGSGGT